MAPRQEGEDHTVERLQGRDDANVGNGIQKKVADRA
jgi:hypothetical protein